MHESIPRRRSASSSANSAPVLRELRVKPVPGTIQHDLYAEFEEFLAKCGLRLSAMHFLSNA